MNNDVMFLLNETGLGSTGRRIHERKVAQFKFANGFIASVNGTDGVFEVAAIHDEDDHWVTKAYFGNTSDSVCIGTDGVELGNFIAWVAGLSPDFRVSDEYSEEKQLEAEFAEWTSQNMDLIESMDSDGEDEPMSEFAEYIVKENGAVVSDGTHRNSDLIQSFMNALYELDRAKYAELHRDYNDVITKFWGADGDNINYPTDELAVKISYFINEDLFNALNEVAPDGFYFGSHEGDGALFGFWPFDPDEM